MYNIDNPQYHAYKIQIIHCEVSHAQLMNARQRALYLTIVTL